MYEDLFSKRYKLRPTPDGLIHEHVPERARIGLYHMVEPFFEQWNRQAHKAYLELYRRICVAIRIPRNRRVVNHFDAPPFIEHVIDTCDWGQFYDICEVMYHMLYSDSSGKYRTSAVEFSREVNALFRDEGLGYEFRDGKVEKVGSGFIDAQIQQARYLLKEPEFEGADQHFEKAMKAANARPAPDAENCVKDAVSALESVARVILGDDKILLDAAIKELTRKKVIPKPLDQVLAKLNAYRGNEPGVAHGAVDLSVVTVAEAEFVLATAAAAIIYLVAKGES